MPTEQNEAQHTPTPGQWEILYDDHAKEYYLSEVGGFAVQMHPFRLSDLERIVRAVKCWDALVEALEDAVVRLETIAELARKAPLEIGQDIYNNSYAGKARRALAAAKEDDPKSEGNK